MYKVLVVEDEDIIRKGLTYKVDWLKNDCIVVGSAVDGNDGLEKVVELQPDLVVTDIRMPFKDGIAMLEEGLKTHDFETIIISGYGEFEYAKKAISLGVSEYILKPIDLSIFDQAVKKLIGKIEAKSNQVLKWESLSIYRELLDVKSFSKQSTPVTDMLEYIKENHHKKLSLSDLSEAYHVSSAYLNAKFKEGTGYTFNDFLNRFRIMKAIEMIKESNMLIYEIAELVGFKDYKYFSQVFKKYVGYSPSNFIRRREVE
ncbi:response regulator [Pseudogracilibacillus auburnensis]|uniref:AraC family two component transcriptional regulator n=1 Tax=Pseudogracilibacillus auburnensis TaxID=1494959 RepID=A0A2V3VVJ4_9BACI|nr:response regulator [Pseudogracilibacillus auburnensis]MBO1001772.1 response regulator [Pseudogracilibacillus auburnensis]PXW86002.1 AraC family two component transcriptional regulator [Pseudogracilibacillus auburnensis]